MQNPNNFVPTPEEIEALKMARGTEVPQVEMQPFEIKISTLFAELLVEHKQELFAVVGAVTSYVEALAEAKHAEIELNKDNYEFQKQRQVNADTHQRKIVKEQQKHNAKLEKAKQTKRPDKEVL